MSKKSKKSKIIVKKPLVQTVKCISLGDLIPRFWQSWFWNTFNNCCSVSFGDSSYTLISKSELINILGNVLEAATEEKNITFEEAEQYVKEIEKLLKDGVYINLEA